MPLYVNDGKAPIDSDGISVSVHAATNHAGIPGVGDLTSAAHATTNHSGITGVGKVVRQVRARTNTVITCATALPFDDTIPQQTEGDEVITVSITPGSTSNILLIEFTCSVGTSTNSTTGAALFRDAGADAIAAMVQDSGAGARVHDVVLRHYVTAPSTSPQTYKIRVGMVAGVCYVNGDFTGTRLYGGIQYATLTVTEMTP